MPQAQEAGSEVARSVGCRDRRTVLTCLRQTPVAKLLRRSDLATAAAYGTSALPTDPATSLSADGRAVLSGNTHDEQRLVAATFALLRKPITKSNYGSLLETGFGSRAAAVAARYPLTRYATAAYAWAAAYTDQGYVCPQIVAGERLARQAPVIGYEFDDPSAPPAVPAVPGFDAGASHASELFYLFDLTTGPLRIDGSRYGLSTQQRAVANTMIDAWSSFARSARPGAKSAWPTLNSSDSLVHRFTAKAAPSQLVDASKEHHCEFWN